VHQVGDQPGLYYDAGQPINRRLLSFLLPEKSTREHTCNMWYCHNTWVFSV